MDGEPKHAVELQPFGQVGGQERYRHLCDRRFAIFSGEALTGESSA